ncbi:MAG: DNA polymerase III subunit delta [Anaerolineales bacterium]|nr:DNA polymerase III subunit delta [Anaerolineales bacterium]MDW8445682.1 DNA polymerase III subunit delta [Anaerolineales bacterium]
MIASKPIVYLLQAEDEFAAAQFIASMENKIGSEGIAALNVQRLDGKHIHLETLREQALAIPFFSGRRLIILDNPLALVDSESAQAKLLALLEQVPPSTAVVLLEKGLLTDPKDYQKGKRHWLERWAEQHPERVYMRQFRLRRGVEMVQFILERAKQLGGDFSRAAAERLAEIVAEDSRRVDMEIRKLLDYVNYRRTVDISDVDQLCPYPENIENFALANALREGDGRKALKVLRQMLNEQDAILVFFSVVHQFRQIVLAKLALEEGETPSEAVQVLSHFRIPLYPARIALEQAQKFRLETLHRLYQRFLAIDISIKSGEIDAEVALETLVAALTLRPSSD